MKNIFNIMSATSFAGVVFLIGMTVYANMTRQARIDENREYIKSVIEKQVYQSIQLTMPPVTGKVNVGNKQINIPNIAIPKFGTNDVWLNGVPFVPNNDPPVTLQLGFPIVDMPGCVTMHKDNKDQGVTGLPFDKDLVNQDEKVLQLYVLMVSIQHMMRWTYTPEQLIIQRETPPPPVSPPPEIEPPEIPDTGNVGGKEEVPCPGPAQLKSW